MELSSEQIKKQLGIYAADFIKPGMVIGLGTGTTAYWLIDELGKRVQAGLSTIKIVPTSLHTQQLASDAGIPLSDLDAELTITLTIDGADEIDPDGQMIKGGGGALLQEKIVAHASDKLIIIADHSKLVKQLGKFPLPVEVIPFAYKRVRQEILHSGLARGVELRQKEGEAFVTDHGHYILDCEYHRIEAPSALNTALHAIPGVVETGLFINMATLAIIGYPDGRIEERQLRK